MDASLNQRIDFKHLAVSLGRPETVRRMIDLYINTTPQSLRELEKAERENNIEQWLETIRSIKAASQNITARRIAILCLEAEEINELPHQRSKAALYHLHKEYELLCEMVAKHYGGGRDSML